jgi:hypothetical protein
MVSGPYSVNPKISMELLKQFLNYPNLFSGAHGAHDRTMAPVNNNWVGRTNLLESSVRTKKKSGVFSTGKLPAIPLVWGTVGYKGHNYYHRPATSWLSTRTVSITEVKEDAKNFSAKISISNWKNLNVGLTNYNQNNRKLILEMMARDLKTAAFYSVPWIKEIVDDFLTANPEPWGNTGQNITQRQQEFTYVVPAKKLTEQQCKDISSRIDSGWNKFTTNTKWPKDFKLKTPSVGLPDGNPTTATVDSPTIRTNPNPDTKVDTGGKPFFNIGKEQTAHSFMLDVNNIEECKLGVHICWRSSRLIESYSASTARRRYQSPVNTNIWYPEIAGFSLIPVPKNGTSISINLGESVAGAAHSGISSNPAKPYQIDYFVRVVDQTQKRQAKGGYRGDYQGIKTMVFGNSIYWKVYQKNALSAIASGAPITGVTFRKLVGDSKRELPMSIETYERLPRPEVDVKPIELGHLLLYRIAESPPKQVSAEILSDMLLPSMPSLLLAIDSPLRIASNDSYTSGLECYGPCDDDEELDYTISPGLYTISRKDKCSRGHDPGRKEYTLGFGNDCNEIITIRRMLAELNVFYDEFRGNYVGSVITEPTPTSPKSASASRLFGRF